MRFRSFDALRLFNIVAQNNSFSDAAEALNLSKGAISYQIKQLEHHLGFKVFERRHDGARLTVKGESLFLASKVMFDGMEREIDSLRSNTDMQITVAMTTYFASRWLSPRLMRFTTAYPGITIRLQPTVGLVDPGRDDVDIVIRWGKGGWPDLATEQLFRCPLSLFASPGVARRCSKSGLEMGLQSTTLLDDDQQSGAWTDWCEAVGLTVTKTRERLIIPDPNVRLQAVIDDQGVAFFDALARSELAAGRVEMIGGTQLPDYGYHLVYRRDALGDVACRHFRDWIVAQSERGGA